MADPRYPGADWNPGINAGYAAGQTPMLSCVAHWTVGVDSTSIGKQGLFQFLVSRDGYVQQFAEADAVCWHAGNPYNRRGPGVEIEYYEPQDGDAVFTDAARTACGKLIHWLNSEWGIPLAYRHGDPRDSTWNGFIGHDGITSDADPHFDYWPQADWDLMVATPPVSKGSGMLYTIDQASFYAYEPHVGFIPATTYSNLGWLQIDQATYDRMNKAAQAPVPGGPGPVTVPVTAKVTGTLTVSP